MQPTPNERKALQSVKRFVDKKFPNSLVVLHASVFWDDDIFTRLTEADAKKLGIANKKCVRGELTPDYAVFALSDIVCAYHKTRKGKPDCRIEKDSDEFLRIAEYDKHIPYIHVDKPEFKVPSGRVTVIAVKPGTRAIAVLDHKGGSKDFNSPSSRGRVILQGKRFSTNNIYMVVNMTGNVDEKIIRPKATYVTSVGDHRFFSLE